MTCTSRWETHVWRSLFACISWPDISGLPGGQANHQSSSQFACVAQMYHLNKWPVNWKTLKQHYSFIVTDMLLSSNNPNAKASEHTPKFRRALLENCSHWPDIFPNFCWASHQSWSQFTGDVRVTEFHIAPSVSAGGLKGHSRPSWLPWTQSYKLKYWNWWKSFISY